MTLTALATPSSSTPLRGTETSHIRAAMGRAAGHSYRHHYHRHKSSARGNVAALAAVEAPSGVRESERKMEVSPTLEPRVFEEMEKELQNLQEELDKIKTKV